MIIEPCFIERGATIGENCLIGPFVVIAMRVTIGNNVTIGPGSTIGTPPQHWAFVNKDSGGGVIIGHSTIIREHVTIHAATRPGANTMIGKRCMLMAGTHVGHDCIIEDGVTLAAPKLSGHTHVMANANVGLGAVTHQYTVIGTGAMVGCGTVVVKDVPPYRKVAGNPVQDLGENHHLSDRAGATTIDAETSRFIGLRRVDKRGDRCL